MRKILIFFLSLMVLNDSAGLARIISVGSNSARISVFTTAKLSRSFIVVGKVTVQASQQNELLTAMREKAAELGGDAVLLYQVLATGQTPVVLTTREDVKIFELKSGDTTISHTRNQPVAGPTVLVESAAPAQAEGVIVKFDNFGMQEITDAVPIPLLD